MIGKSVFECEKCGYFPVKEETEKYFLNLNTFKCPMCSQVTMFNPIKYFILDEEFIITDMAQVNTDQNEDIIKDSKHMSDKVQNQKSMQKQEKTSNKEVVLILIQESENYTQSFYLNAINPKLRGSFNIDKQRVLRQNEHPIFGIHNEFILRNKQKFVSQNIHINFGKRTVSKGEHLFYCLDQYIKQISNVLMGKQEQQRIYEDDKKVSENSRQKQKDIRIVILTIKKKQCLLQKLQQSTQPLVINQNKGSANISKSPQGNENYRIENIKKIKFFWNQLLTMHNNQFQVTHAIDINYIDYFISKQPNHKKDNHTSSQSSIKIKMAFESFFKHLYFGPLQQYDQLQQTKRTQLIEQEYNTINANDFDLSFVAVFSDNFDADLIASIRQNISNTSIRNNLIKKKQQPRLQQQSITTTKYNNTFMHYFYLTETRQNSLPSIIQNSIHNKEIEGQGMCILSMCKLFQPYSNAKNNLSDMIVSVTKESISSSLSVKSNQQSQLDVNQRNNETIITDEQQINRNYAVAFYFTNNINSNALNKDGSYQQSTTKRIASQKVHMSMNSLQQSLVLANILKENENSYHKQLCSISSNQLSHEDKLRFTQSIHQSIKNIENTHLQNINKSKIDRLIFHLDKRIKIYFVVNFDSIRKQNYESIDFLDLNSLPPQLKNYPSTYQNIQHLNQHQLNPFRKTNNRVFMLVNQYQPKDTQNQSQPYNYDYEYDDSDQMQTL